MRPSFCAVVQQGSSTPILGVAISPLPENIERFSAGPSSLRPIHEDHIRMAAR
jgi:hypothetical protein